VGLAHVLSSPASTETTLSKIVAAPTPDPRFIQFHGDCQTYGVAYEDPDDSIEDREKVFGKANDQNNLIEVSFFNYAVTVHRKVAPCLLAVQRDLQDQQTTYVIKEVGGYREDRPDRLYWFHQYGAAIDINPAQNPQCLKFRRGVDPAGRCTQDKPYDIPESWVETFERYGFYWGGNFDDTKDYMHFEWHGEKP
jgi:hypothetical protein